MTRKANMESLSNDCDLMIRKLRLATLCKLSDHGKVKDKFMEDVIVHLELLKARIRSMQ